MLQSFETDRPAVTAGVKADGSFEFQSIPKGFYSATIMTRKVAFGSVRSWYLSVENQDIHSLEFRLATGPESEGYGIGKAPIATGTVIIRDVSGRRIDAVPAGVLIRFVSTLPGITSVGMDGSFTVPACCGINTISFVGLPPGYSIQAMTSNGVDLLKSPLVVEGRTPPAEIQIVLEYKQP